MANALANVLAVLRRQNCNREDALDSCFLPLIAGLAAPVYCDLWQHMHPLALHEGQSSVAGLNMDASSSLHEL
jgi:hypothetical protein